MAFLELSDLIIIINLLAGMIVGRYLFGGWLGILIIVIVYFVSKMCLPRKTIN